MSKCNKVKTKWQGFVSEITDTGKELLELFENVTCSIVWISVVLCYQVQSVLEAHVSDWTQVMQHHIIKLTTMQQSM